MLVHFPGYANAHVSSYEYTLLGSSTRVVAVKREAIYRRSKETCGMDSKVVSKESNRRRGIECVILDSRAFNGIYKHSPIYKAATGQ